MLKMEQYERAAAYINRAVGTADTAIVLGSGLGGYEEAMTDVQTVPYSGIPEFPVSTVPGHAGRLSVGTLSSKRVMMMSGRFHSYEGYGMDEVTMPVRVMHLLGVRTLILTNAAGGVNELFSPGDLMLITDYINYSGKNPLIGPNLEAFGPRFPDMSRAYDVSLRDLAKKQAQSLGIPLKEGVYCCFSGPTYETPAEVRMARVLGADAVGMSTVPETMVARHCGMRVLAISTITNMAAGIADGSISHDEVMQVSGQVKGSFTQLMNAIVSHLS